MEYNWSRVFDVLVLITVVSMMTERALALIFESRRYMDKFPKGTGKGGRKEIICAIVGITVCVHWKIDAMYVITGAKETSTAGMILTGLIVAGGSKASVKLFQDVMGIKSSTKAQLDAQRAATVTEGGK